MNYIKLITLALSLALVSTSWAQVDRSKAPAPAPAPKIKLGKAKTYTLDNGLKVFVVENHKIPRVSIQLSIDRDPIFEGDAAGYIAMSGDLMSSGTTNRSKAQIDEEIDFIGGNLNTSSTGLFASSLTKHIDKLMDLTSDVLYNPSFPQEELDKLKTQTISGLAANKNDPNAIAGNVRGALRFGLDHPYGELETEESVEKITVDMCHTYYNTYWKPNIAYLVIVGDLKAKEGLALAEKYFGKWEKGVVPSHKFSTPVAPSKTRVCFVDKPGAVQSVINVTYPVDLKPGSPEEIKADVMNGILGGGAFSGRLMQNLREDKAYTYGARSSLNSDELVGSFTAFASVRNEVTDSAVVEFLVELKKIRDNKVSADELSKTKNIMNGNFARSLERPQTIAGFALNTVRYNLPEDYYATYLTKLEAVTIDEVNASARKYIKPDNALIIVVGSAGEVAEKLARFAGSGEVEYFDIYGNVTVANTLKPVPAGVTAQTVVDKYLTVRGGMDALNEIKDIETIMNGAMGGMELQMTVHQQAPNKFALTIGGNGMTLSREVYNGEKGWAEQMGGQRADVTGKELDGLKASSTLNLEGNYTALGYKLNLLGIEDVEGVPAYKMDVMDPVGGVETDYYDVVTGLKIRTVATQESPQGEVQTVIQYGDYKAVDGVQFPHTVTQSFGPQELTFKAATIKINGGLEATAFE